MISWFLEPEQAAAAAAAGEVEMLDARWMGRSSTTWAAGTCAGWPGSPTAGSPAQPTAPAWPAAAGTPSTPKLRDVDREAAATLARSGCYRAVAGKAPPVA
jgi:hypothetical protein